MPPALSRPPAAPLHVRPLTADADLALAYPAAAALRPHLTPALFAALVARQRAGGYVLAGGFDPAGRLVALAGYRLTSTLARGPHLFVDDLVTVPGEHGRGRGTAMLAWLRAAARAAGVDRVYLDSRDTAAGFYEQAGFTFLTSKPCWAAAGDEPAVVT